MSIVTAEQKDEIDLREAESKIKEIMQLMKDGHHREKADAELEKAREGRAGSEGDKTPAFHKHEGASVITTTKHTKSLLDLAETLKIRIKLGQHALELEDSLNRAAMKQVDILERQLKRARY